MRCDKCHTQYNRIIFHKCNKHIANEAIANEAIVNKAIVKSYKIYIKPYNFVFI